MGCSVPGCKSKSKEGIKFCRLPQGRNDLARRNAWLSALNRPEKWESASTCLICERHFLPEDWESPRIDGTRKLRASAVPSINLLPVPQRNQARTPFADLSNKPSSDSSKKVNHSTDIREEHSYASVTSRGYVDSVSSNPTFSTAAPSKFYNENIDISKSLRQASKDIDSVVGPNINIMSSLKLCESSVCQTPKFIASAVNSRNLSESSNMKLTISGVFDDLSRTSTTSTEQETSVSLMMTNSNHEQNISLSNSLDIKNVSEESKRSPIEHNFTVILNSLAKAEEENKILKEKAAKYDKLMKEVCVLRRVIKTERKAKERLKKNISLSHRRLQNVLSPDQFRSTMRNSTKGMKFSNASLQEGLLFKSQCGTAGYGKISQRFGLPSARTLQLRTEHIKMKSGILTEVLEELKSSTSSMSEIEKDCVLGFDEMAITPNDRLYDPSTKAPIGSATLPGHNGPGRKALVYMIGGVTTRWKLAVAYYFTSAKEIKGKDKYNMQGENLKNITMEVIKHVETCGVRVRAVVCDMGPDNRAMFKALKISAKRSGECNVSFENPFDTTRVIHCLPDGPHVFKSCVQMLISNQVITLPDNFVKTFNLPSHTVELQHIKDLMDFESNYEVKVAFRLEEESFRKGHFDKMKMSSSRAIFNHRTKVGVERLAEKTGKQEYKTTAWFLGLFLKWSDYTSSRCPALALSKKNPEKYEEALGHIMLTAQVFQHMKVGQKGEWKPVQEAVIMISYAIFKLQEYFLNERGYHFLLTSRFTQDFVENFFSQIRRRQALPNALMFKSILKELIVAGVCCRPPRGSSYDYDEGCMLLNMLSSTSTSNASSSENSFETFDQTNSIDAVHCPVIEDKDIYEIIDDWELTVLYDMSGAALHSLIEMHKWDRACPCVSSLLWHDSRPHPFSSLTLDKNYKTGAQMEVSDECFVALVKSEIIFRILRVPLLKEKEINVVDYLCKKSSYVWKDLTTPPCHKNIKFELTKRFLTIRLKQYGLHGKKSLQDTAAIYASKSLAMRALVRRVHLPAS